MKANARSLRRSCLLLAAAIVLFSCYVTSISGPGSVTVGETGTWDVGFATDMSGTNGTAWVFLDVPTSWEPAGATYDGTVNGAPVSGTASQADPSTSPCSSQPIAPGYQRVAYTATFPTTVSGDSGTLHASFVVGGPLGSTQVRTFGAGSFEGGASTCSSGTRYSSDVVVVGPVVAATDVPSLSTWGLLVMGALLAAVALKMTR